MKAAAVLAPAEAEAAYKAALERLKGTRANVYRQVTVEDRRRAWLENRELEKGPGLFSPNYRDPENLGEWLDDQLVQWHQFTGCPEHLVVATVIEAARQGTAEAVKALRAAEDLDPRVAFAVFENIRLWGKADERYRAHAGQLAAALLAEWSRLQLPELDPVFTAPPKRRRRTWEKTEATA